MLQATHTTEGTAPPEEGFRLDLDELRALASEPVMARGVAYFKENRVVELGWDARCIQATVEGSAPVPYEVRLFRDEASELCVECDCPFDWEPVCKHALAAGLAWAARQPPSPEALADAASAAVEQRRLRAKGEVLVEHVEGEPHFGTWRARSVHRVGPAARSWRVDLRSTTERVNHCTCPDFAVNRLGTCKHIEAVLHALKRKRRGRRAPAERPRHIVHLDWNAERPPAIRIHPAPAPEWVAPLFDKEGALNGELPEAFHALEAAVAGEPDVVLSQDAVRHARRAAEAASGALRARRIREDITSHGGRLPGVNARLYPYQVEGVAFLAARGRGLLADDMGLGKTLQAIAAATWLHRAGDVERALVVCPASLKHQWAREIERFTGLDAEVVGGPPTARHVQYRRRAAFTIVNYELVLRDESVLCTELAPDLLVLDEAQRIKNWRTRTAEAIKRIPTERAFVLTGTPLENRLEDLYSLMQVVDPEITGPLWRYWAEFHVTDERGRVLGYRNLSELRRRLRPAMLRRDRRLVRDQLPDRVEVRLDVKMDRRQTELHDEAMNAAASLARIMKRRPLTPSEEQRLLSSLQRARMACNAAVLVDENAPAKSPKLDELRRILEDVCVEEGRKVVVFSQWERMTKLAEEVAGALGLGTVRLHGGVATGRRGALIERFREDPATQVFISTDAGGVGLNLQAGEVLVNLDLPWNPAVLAQRVARVHRLGQKAQVQILLLVSPGGYEGRIATLLRGKRALFRNVVTEDATEDAVGVSKRALEVALATLSGDQGSGDQESGDQESDDQGSGGEARPGTEAPTAPPSSGDPPGPSAEPEADDLGPALSSIQAHFGPRLDRIFATPGALIAILDRAEPTDHAAAAEIEAPLPVAVLDGPTWDGLQRLGAASPLAGARALEAPIADAEPEKPALLRRAARKLRAARALLGAEQPQEALGLLLDAMCARLAHRAGDAEPPLPTQLPVWLYGELVPAGHADADEATAVLRARALFEAADVPEALLAGALHDAERIVSS